MEPSELPQALQHHASMLGVDRISVYVADVQQDQLVMLPQRYGNTERQLPIGSSDAGRAYRNVTEHIAVGDSGGLVLWLPLIDGIERLGVLCVEADTISAQALQLCRSLSTIVTLVMFTQGLFSDTYARFQRTQKMEISAEMVWAFLPPRSIGSRMTTSSATLEPAYDLGGDAFDHSLVDHMLHVTIIDSMGHDLSAGMSSAVALAACRNARRSGTPDLGPLVEGVNRALLKAFDARHTTSIFAQLHLETGQLEWVNAGHPPPLLLRNGEVVDRALERDPEPPLGLPDGLAESTRTVHEAHLQPQDRVLFYTDGVVDARSPSGEDFGIDRFTDFILRAIAADEAPPETLRRLTKAILQYQHGPLVDDATIVMFQWHPSRSPDYFF
ncbi:PP2C family protein-serine/threonine phosphatase [Nocardiopsis sp. NPDC058631]|uniref:PP2C family protein-serine/threonine phosphatase n=1 Tax=Nocardiopsis sp. NPDC058631 TaxID=3346566 RepID=UPI00365D5357